MADVTILYAREDRERALSVETALAGSGFSVASAPADALPLRLESPALVALWSRALAGSRAALEAANQAMTSGRLVSARLDINVPNTLFRGHPMHDLARWSGDPDDAALDALIAEADRRVLAARLNPPPPVVEKPIAPLDPPPRPAAAVGGGARTAARPAPANDLEPELDPAAEEARFWKTIRNSVNRADFEAYLARFGPDGLFAELAQARLAALPAPAPPPPPPAPSARFADAWRFGADWSTRSTPPTPAAPQDPGVLSRRPAPAPSPPIAPPPAPMQRAPQPAPEPARRAAPMPRPAAGVSIPHPSEPARAAPMPAPQPAARRQPPPFEPPPRPVAQPPIARPPQPQPAAPVAFDRELGDAPWERGAVAAPPPQIVVQPETRAPVEPDAPPRARRRRRRGGMGGLFFFLVLASAGAGGFYWFVVAPELNGGGETGGEETVFAAGDPSFGAPVEETPEASAPETELEPTTLGPAPETAAPDAGAPEAAAPQPSLSSATPLETTRRAPPPVSTERPAQRDAASPTGAAPADAGASPTVPVYTPPPAAAQPQTPPASTAAPPRQQGPSLFSYGRPAETTAMGPDPSVRAPITPPRAATTAAPAQRQVAGPDPTARATPATQPTRPQSRARVVWARQPSAETVASAYPGNALRREIEGRASLSCVVLPAGDLNCAVASETPTGQGFGRAALEVARRYKASARLSDGTPSAGVETQLTIQFKAQ